MTIGAPSTDQDQGTATDNLGTLQVTDGGHLGLSSSSTLSTSGTLGVTVDSGAGVSGVSSSATVTVSGTIAVTTVGSPTLNTTYAAITGPISGTFTGFSFGTRYYVVTYPANEVQIEIEQGFTASATSFSPKENESITPQLATLGDTNDEPGTYSATVNYGDGTGIQTATVTLTSPTGTVTGPAHAYTTPGTYTVTTVVSNTSGTTYTLTGSVTVTGPTITGFSKTTIKQGKKLSTTVSGTGFDPSAGSPGAWTTSNPGITVVSAKVGKVSKKHPNPTIKLKLSASKTAALGPFSVTLTQDNGSTTVVNAITVSH
jgi:hypothetical protein